MNKFVSTGFYNLMRSSVIALLLASPFLLTLALAPPAFAQVAPTGEIEEVVVIGSRVRDETLVNELPVPVDLLQQTDLERMGDVDLGAGLAKLVPSANYSRQSVGDGALLRAATLRGLNPDQTLVLINGKRRHNMAWLRVLDGVIGYGTSGTDLAAIPSSAISRIEVLRDGAAAQYGSDAIAGVINLQLNERSDGGEITLHAGEGDTGNQRTGAAFNGGLPLGEGGFVNVTAEWFEEDPIQRNGGNGGFDPNFQDVLIVDSYPEQEARFFFLNAALPLDGESELYAFGGLSEREGSSSGAYRFAHNYWQGLESGSPSWDAIIPEAINFHERNTHPVYPDGFLPYEESNVDDVSVVIGWRTTVADWDIDLSAGYGHNEFEFGVSNSINASIGAHYLALNPGASVADIVANSGPTSGSSGGIEFDQLTFNFDLRRSFNNSVAVALGLEHRDEKYKQTAGDDASWSCGQPHTADYSAFAVGPKGMPLDGVIAACGFQGYPGYSPENARLSDRNRDSWGAYVELELQPSTAFAVVSALRAEDYSDAGSQITGKLAARLTLTEELAVRGAASTGFRAPSLSQRGFNSIVFVGSEEGLTSTLGVHEGHEVARALGVESLRHETSNNISLGFVWTRGDFSLSLDAYRIEISDRIVRTRGIDCSGIAECDNRHVTKTAFFFNGVDTETDGYDLSARWGKPFGSGQFTLTASLHGNKTEIVARHLPSGAPPQQNFDNYYGGWAADVLENGQPKRQANITADWGNDTFGAMLRLSHYGKTNQHPLDTGLIRVKSAILADVEARWQLGRFNIALGVNNVTDELPTELPKTHLANILWGMKYPNDTPFGLVGRFAYLRLKYGFGG